MCVRAVGQTTYVYATVTHVRAVLSTALRTSECMLAERARLLGRNRVYIHVFSELHVFLCATNVAQGESLTALFRRRSGLSRGRSRAGPLQSDPRLRDRTAVKGLGALRTLLTLLERTKNNNR